MVNLIFDEMSIVASLQNTDDSPWYKIMEEKGQAWNNFAKEIGAEIDGHYNADLLEFDITLFINGIEVSGWGLRNLTSVTTNFMPSNGAIVEELKLTFDKQNLNQTNSFSIKRNNFKNMIFSYFSKYKNVKRTEKYIIYYNSDFCYNELMSRNILGYNSLNKVELNAKGFALHLFYLPSEIESLRKIFSFCEWAVGVK